MTSKNKIPSLSAEDESSFFSLATEYLEAASILHATPATKLNVSLVSYYLAGHAAELFLKSFLFNRGIVVIDLKKKYGHDLKKLVEIARNKGLPSDLSNEFIEEFSKNYFSKHTEYRRLASSTYPPLELLISQIRELESQVFHHIVSSSEEAKSNPSSQPAVYGSG